MFQATASKQSVIPKPDPGFGIYIHWPFCLAKCPYCDFNSHVSDTVDHDVWANSLLKELRYSLEKTKKQTVTSIFFGGGTPSLMKPRTVERLIEAVQQECDVASDLEVTLEANPTSIEAGKFKDFVIAGVTRVSVGVQSLSDTDLKFLGREHSAKEALEAIEIAKRTFDRYSFDLIYARPQQTTSTWDRELRQALTYADGHLSLYQLTIEKGTAFYTQHQRGDFAIPSEELAADFYDLTEEIMTEAGYQTYEVSNYAKKRMESRHNLTYWRYGDYVGIGPGAHGRLSIEEGHKIATRTHRAPSIWLEKVKAQGHGWHEPEILDSDIQTKEAVMMGLRLQEGILFDLLPDINKAHHLINEKQAIIENDRFILTHEGRKRLNAILGYLLV